MMSSIRQCTSWPLEEGSFMDLWHYWLSFSCFKILFLQSMVALDTSLKADPSFTSVSLSSLICESWSCQMDLLLSYSSPLAIVSEFTGWHTIFSSKLSTHKWPIHISRNCPLGIYTLSTYCWLSCSYWLSSVTKSTNGMTGNLKEILIPWLLRFLKI